MTKTWCAPWQPQVPSGISRNIAHEDIVCFINLWGNIITIKYKKAQHLYFTCIGIWYTEQSPNGQYGYIITWLFHITKKNIFTLFRWIKKYIILWNGFHSIFVWVE